MAMVAGLAVGIWLFGPEVAEAYQNSTPHGLILLTSAVVLGGLAVVGPPLLLAERRRNRSPWGAGKVLWFASGTSAWLLWPPIIARRVGLMRPGQSGATMCFAYGTPLMAVYVTASLLAGGWLGRRRRRQMARSWSERFGLVLGMAWACTGLYVLWMIYRDDFR
jgi:hypothetical protein